MKDIFGKALLDYQNGNYTEDIITSTSISDEDILPLPYLFRSFSEMPKLEQKALQLAKGYVLDVGCGTGSHSLYLEKKGLHVKAIDISKGAIHVAKQRGVTNAEAIDILDETETFDTILLLMNGTGIFQELIQVSKYLKHLKSLLKPNGQILIDSSDIKYMYEDEDGGFWVDTSAEYYGELDYFISYKGEKETPLKWLYLDFNTLKLACETVGLHCELIKEGEHFDYLARITDLYFTKDISI
ncbi:class I SAM-dependent methyltransferase [Seonamhaeicola maritimus]|uniref:Class I SAM-dependent methyltransferase n=1 Tax=Seonamhaeicola maritimus TaxID=2591822 RepID=A0A5C7GDK1_9FLAO|nr:class I SAM-dependent methyltransferase [Seonamhaeicola maritimus]TXG34547.1 class I SAM-dependent methyltransferase [Seonamhaeicola maritimus]